MKTELSILKEDLQRALADLRRPHPFAAERVGFLFAKPAINSGALRLVIHDYEPVADAHYLDDPTVGAMISGAAFRRVMQRLIEERSSAFHVHLHEHRGQPRFSGVDLSESIRFVPSFFNARADTPHGVCVLSADSAIGKCWLAADTTPLDISRFVVPGFPSRIWRYYQHEL
jgi:hypothetical protein